VSLLRRMTAVALLGGGAAGLVWFALQVVWVTPLVHQAEVYETHAHSTALAPAQPPAPASAPAAAAPAGGTAGAPPGGAAGATAGPASSPGSALERWLPSEGLQRAGLTALSDLLAGVGFALLLVAGMTLRGAEPTPAAGLVWGLAGYASVMLAPALGLPPALPGAAVAPLGARQLWWLGTVGATAAGLGLLAFAPRWIKPIGLALLAAPHAVGAPVPPLDAPELLPSALAARYVAAVLVTGAAFWAALGTACGWLLRRAMA
jgi:cobalt transporter subunit CbtA